MYLDDEMQNFKEEASRYSACYLKNLPSLCGIILGALQVHQEGKELFVKDAYKSFNKMAEFYCINTPIDDLSQVGMIKMLDYIPELKDAMDDIFRRRINNSIPALKQSLSNCLEEHDRYKKNIRLLEKEIQKYDKEYSLIDRRTNPDIIELYANQERTRRKAL